MTPNDPALLVLAEAVADGSDVDWAHAESSASTPDERRVIQQLGHLARLGLAARSQPDTWGPFEIRDTIGRGTFGTVHLAWDPRLERDVALKILHAQAHGPNEWTLLSEARLLARVRHPNVVMVYGADAVGGRIGIAMELVSGQTLKAIVEAQGPMSAAEAALIGRDICRALAAVHGQGFLHRDVKAQNVMREGGGRTVLMDFGAGDAVRAEGDAAPALRGTPVYLAPEVLDGAPPTERSDLYSVGVLLFFLVTGTFPIVAGSLDELRERHARGAPKRLRDVRADIPAAFVAVVERATAANPDDRPQSAGALEALLEAGLVVNDREAREPIVSDGGTRQRATSRVRMAAYAAAALVVLATAAFITARWSGAASGAGVAVLPFENLAGDVEADAFGRGVASRIAARLTGLGTQRVVSGAAVDRYRGSGKSAAEIGAELHVAAVLVGSLTRRGSQVRLDSQLVDAQSGERLWADSFVRELNDAARPPSDVSYEIADALKAEVSLADADTLGARRPKDWETFALYQSGRYYYRKRLEEHLRTSLEYYQKALSRDPRYAPAYAGIADTYSLLGVSSMMDQADALSRAGAAATKALALDPTLAEAHASLGYIHKHRFEWERAEAELRRAIELKPRYAQAHHWYSIYLSQHGRFAEAVDESKTAISLDPQAVATNAQLGTVLSLYRRYDDSIAQFEKVLSIDERYLSAHQIIGENQTYKGEYELALASLAKAAKVAPLGLENHELLADTALALIKSGQRAAAEQVLAQLLDRQRRNPRNISAHIASVYGALGDRDQAFTWLSQAMTLRDRQIGYLKVDPRWDSLRDDPRFDTLLARMGFAPSVSSH